MVENGVIFLVWKTALRLVPKCKEKAKVHAKEGMVFQVPIYMETSNIRWRR
jgi:hypothetical protein